VPHPFLFVWPDPRDTLPNRAGMAAETFDMGSLSGAAVAKGRPRVSIESERPGQTVDARRLRRRRKRANGTAQAATSVLASRPHARATPKARPRRDKRGAAARRASKPRPGPPPRGPPRHMKTHPLGRLRTRTPPLSARPPPPTIGERRDARPRTGAVLRCGCQTTGGRAPPPAPPPYNGLDRPHGRRRGGGARGGGLSPTATDAHADRALGPPQPSEGCARERTAAGTSPPCAPGPPTALEPSAPRTRWRGGVWGGRHGRARWRCRRRLRAAARAHTPSRHAAPAPARPRRRPALGPDRHRPAEGHGRPPARAAVARPRRPTHAARRAVRVWGGRPHGPRAPVVGGRRARGRRPRAEGGTAGSDAPTPAPPPSGAADTGSPPRPRKGAVADAARASHGNGECVRQTRRLPTIKI